MTGEAGQSTPFDPLPPEVATLVLSVTDEAALSASRLGDTWYLRPTPDLRDKKLERIALTAIISLVVDAEQLVTRATAWRESGVLHALEPLEDIKANLPYTADELTILRDIAASWDRKTRTWRPSLSEEAQALVNHWHTWLRDPEPDPRTGELFISNEAGHLCMACVSLFYRLDGRQLS